MLPQLYTEGYALKSQPPLGTGLHTCRASPASACKASDVRSPRAPSGRAPDKAHGDCLRKQQHQLTLTPTNLQLPIPIMKRCKNPLQYKAQPRLALPQHDWLPGCRPACRQEPPYHDISIRLTGQSQSR